jgi:UDP-N-acetylmuramoyl-L-alanyl-D-glutamate--2,6-diaminopimelate ligase
MILSSLLKKCKIIDTNIDLNIEISSIEADSRNIIQNSVFVSIVGENRDGNNYINKALNQGAIAIITDVAPKEKSLPYILVENAREALAKMYSEYYENPTRAMKIIAITGTNGKTSTAYCLYNILKKAKKSCKPLRDTSKIQAKAVVL